MISIRIKLVFHNLVFAKFSFKAPKKENFRAVKIVGSRIPPQKTRLGQIQAQIHLQNNEWVEYCFGFWAKTTTSLEKCGTKDDSAF